MEKRGVGHIEIILSFVLFFTFVSIAFYFFSPLKASKLADSSLPYAFSDIEMNTSVEIISYSVKIVNGQNKIAVEIADAPEGNVRVENYDGEVLPSRRNGNSVYFERDGSDFVFIKFSEDFLPSSFTNSGNNANYELASRSSKRVISEKRLLELNKSYYSDYLNTKRRLNIPDSVDFSFSLAFPDGKIIKTEKDAPVGQQVFSDIKRKEVLRENGDSLFSEIQVKIW